MSEGYVFDESGARKLVADHKRLAQIPQGGPLESFRSERSDRDWCSFQYANVWAQDNSERGEIGSGYSTAYENGNTNHGKGTLWFYYIYGEPRNVGLRMHTMSAYEHAWATVTRTGVYWVDLSIFGYPLWNVQHTGGSVSTETASGHTHGILNAYLTSRFRSGILNIKMRYKESSGSWTVVDNWGWATGTGFMVNNLRLALGATDPYECFRMSQPVYLEAGWKIHFDCEFSCAAGKLTQFLFYPWNNICRIEYMGPAPTAAKSIGTLGVAQPS